MDVERTEASASHASAAKRLPTPLRIHVNWKDLSHRVHQRCNLLLYAVIVVWLARMCPTGCGPSGYDILNDAARFLRSLPPARAAAGARIVETGLRSRFYRPNPRPSPARFSNTLADGRLNFAHRHRQTAVPAALSAVRAPARQSLRTASMPIISKYPSSPSNRHPAYPFALPRSEPRIGGARSARSVFEFQRLNGCTP